MSTISDVVVVHGLEQLRGSRSPVCRFIWKMFFFIAITLFVTLWSSTVRQFAFKESLISSNSTPPNQYPVVHLCPEVIPKDGVYAANYTNHIADLLNNIVRTAWKVKGDDTKVPLSNELDKAIEIGRGHPTESVQQMMLNVGKSHKNVLQMNAEEFFFGIQMHLKREPVTLTTVGYCFTYQFEDRHIFSNELGHMYLYLTISNATALKASGRMAIYVSTYDKIKFLPPVHAFYAGLVKVQAQWHKSVRRSTLKRPCKANFHTIEECVVDCTEAKLAAGVDMDTSASSKCQLFSPTSEQLPSEICHGSENEQKIRDKLAAAGACASECTTMCTESYFSHRFQYMDPVRNNLSQKYNKDSSDWSLKFNIQMVGIAGSVLFNETTAVSFSMFFGYTGGNLGVMFGITILAAVELVIHMCFMSFIKQRQKRFKKTILNIGACLVLAGSAPFLISLVQQYNRKETSSDIYLDDIVEQPRVLMISSFLSEEKMIQLLEPEASFIAEENERHRVRNDSFPYLCHMVQGLMLGNPVFDYFDPKMPGFVDHVSKLKGVLEKSQFIKEHGVEELLVRSRYAPEDRIVDVQDAQGQSYAYTQAIRRLGVIWGYEVQVNTSEKTSFAKINGGYRIILPRMMTSDYKCHQRYDALGIVFRQNEEGIGYDLDHFSISKFTDYTFYLSSQRIEVKSKKNRPCIENEPDTSYCIQDCVDTVISCPCKAMFYGESSVAKLTNVTGMCHKLTPIVEQCQLSRTTFQQDVVDACVETCHGVCSRTSYFGQVYPREAKNFTHQYIDIVLVGNSGNFHVREFFSYNPISLTCALGAVFSLFFGYSFVSIFNGMVIISDTVIKRLGFK